MPLPLAIILTILALGTAPILWLARLLRQPRHDASADLAEHSDFTEPPRADAIRLALTPPEDVWPYLPEDRSRGLLPAEHGGGGRA